MQKESMDKLTLTICLILMDAAQLPHLSFLRQFDHCTPHIVNALLEANVAHRHRLEAEQRMHTRHEDWYEEVIQEYKECYRAYDCLRDARNSFYPEQEKRIALWKLRQIIGHERFYSGDMVPHVPLWRLKYVR